jgi:small subunit ribosomal protein S20
MANNKSQIKRIRQSEKRRIFNRHFRNRSRTLVKQARLALAKQSPESAEEAVKRAVQDLDKNASRGVLHKRNAARRKSRLMKQLAALKAGKK